MHNIFKKYFLAKLYICRSFGMTLLRMRLIPVIPQSPKSRFKTRLLNLDSQDFRMAMIFISINYFSNQTS